MRRALGVLLGIAVAGTAAADTSAPVVTHVRIEEAKLGQPLRIRAKIDDESGVFAPTVFVRPKGVGEYLSIPMTAVGDAHEAVIPGEQLAGDLEYFVEAFDEEGNGPAREGSPEAPIVVKVVRPAPPKVVVPIDEAAPPPRDDGPGIVGAWWFWTAIGIAVAGGATAAVLVLTGGPVDAVDVTVRGPAPEGLLR